MNIYYNPLDKRCKNITGGIKQGEKLKIVVFCQGEDFPSDKVLFVLNRDGENARYIEMKRNSYGWSLVLRINEPGLYFYRFKIGDRKLGKDENRNLIFSEDSYSYQLTVYDKNYETPDWFKGGIMYQIFPDRFAKKGDIKIDGRKILRDDWTGTPSFKPNEQGKVLNNDFFGGNFAGIQEKLDYLRSLNVSVIYFNPVFEAYSNHRYDTGDYMKIDPLLGTKEDFENFVSAAKEKGIRVILDGVFNHTGDDSRYFNKYGNYDEVGAFQSESSKYIDWYKFIAFPNVYESWWGIDTLPAMNKNSESYQNFIFGEGGVLKTWLKSGISGYRLDVADELPDFFIKKLRKAVKEEQSDALIIGEVWEDASNKIAYSARREYLQGYELDSVMNYPLKDAIIDFVMMRNTEKLVQTIDMLRDNYPKIVLDSLMNILGTHDTYRILTVLGGRGCLSKDEMSVTFMSPEQKKGAIEKLKVAVLLQFTLPGVPCIYYGDENAMEGYADPFCRRCFDWDNLDTDLIDYYRKIGDVRRNIIGDILKDGEYKMLSSDPRFYMFKRTKSGKAAYVYVNFTDRTFMFKLKGTLRELLSDVECADCINILPESYGIIIKE